MSESKAPTVERYGVSGCGDRNCDPLMGSQEGWLVEFDAYEDMRLERDQLKAECEGLRKDAERYLWIRDEMGGCLTRRIDTEFMRGDKRLDSSIDAAMAKEDLS